MKQILCMKWGTLYGPEYVNRLYAMVARNISGPFRFICLTDTVAGIRDEVACYPCPEIAVPESHRNRPWRKVSLWAAELFDLHGDILFLDLDLVITGNIDCFFDYGEDFVVIYNWTQPGRDIGNTSVYRFTVGSHPYLLERLESDPQAIFAEYPNSQTYISRTIRAKSYWPEAWCRSFKVHCVPNVLARRFLVPRLPEGARIVAFPGVPNPHQALAGEWPSRGLKRLYKHIRPTPWVAEHWRE